MPPRRFRSSFLVLLIALALILPTQAEALTFAASTGSPFAVGTNPFSVALRDINSDGKLDLVTANFSSNNVTVLLGNGVGGFTPAAGSPFAVGTQPFSVALGDVNADGKIDLATANSGASDITVLQGDGLGGFTSFVGSPFMVGTAPFSVALGDLNADGKLDLVTSNQNSGNVSVLLGNGLGGFTDAPLSPFSVGSNPHLLALGDVNNDGKLDVATGRFPTGVNVLLGNGAGSLVPAAGSPFADPGDPFAVAFGDMNADGNLDLASANTESGIGVLLGNGAGAFAAVAGSPFGSEISPHSVVLGDVSGDGKLDVAVANTNSASITVRLGDGFGGFSSATGSPFAAGPGPYALTFKDVNSDGEPDFTVANFSANNVTVLLNTSVRKATPAAPSDFGSQTVGTISSAQTVTVTSGTGLATHISKVTISGTDSDDYLITSDHCTGEVLGDGYAPSCTVGVRYAPSTVGAGSATLDVISDSPASPESAGMTGTGTAASGGTDTDPPETTITDHPPDPTNQTTPTFRFMADEPNATFECSMDTDPFTACTSPFTSAALSVDSHTFSVQATDQALNTDPSPDTYTFTVDTAAPGPDTDPPNTIITDHPPALTNQSQPTFRFTSDEPNATFECRFDTDLFASCDTPFVAFSALSDGSHTFEVRATDQALNTDASPDAYAFTVDATKPTTTITGPTKTSKRKVKFKLAFSEEIVSASCKVDLGAFKPCTDPYLTPKLAPGNHTVFVKTTDAAGNVENPPASHAFKVKN